MTLIKTWIRKKSQNSQRSPINWSWFTLYRFQLEPKKQHFQISITSWNSRTFLTSSCELLGVLWVNKLHIYILIDAVEQKPRKAVKLCLIGVNRFHVIDFFPIVFRWGRCHRLISLWSTDQDCSTRFFYLNPLRTCEL